jgi:Fe-S-cluster containining protein
MTTYKDDFKRLAALCKKCGGRCCIGESITISRNELSLLGKSHSFQRSKIQTSCGTLCTIRIPNGRPCPFLGVDGSDGKAGCVLQGKMRPLGCRLYPLTFLVEKGEVRFYLSDFCPYAREAVKLRGWTRKTIKEACQDLKSWTDREKHARSLLHMKIHEDKKHLMRIKSN